MDLEGMASACTDSAPLHVMQGRDEPACGIRFQPEKSFHERATSGFTMRIESFTDYVQMEDAGLQDAVADDLAEGLFPGAVENGACRRRTAGDIPSQVRRVGIRVDEIGCERVKVGEFLVGTLCFHGGG